MPYETRWDSPGVIWTFQGKVTGQEILQANLDIYSDARFDALKYQLCDFLQTAHLELDPATVKRIAYLDVAAAKSNADIKVAIVTDRGILRDFAKMYAAYSDESNWETRIFNRLEEARSWLLALGLDPSIS